MLRDLFETLLVALNLFIITPSAELVSETSTYINDQEDSYLKVSAVFDLLYDSSSELYYNADLLWDEWATSKVASNLLKINSFKKYFGNE